MATLALCLADELVREQMGLNVYFRKGAAAVMRGEKTSAEIMGDSALQFFVKNELGKILASTFPEHYTGAGELGIYLDSYNYFAADLVVIEKEFLQTLDEHYTRIVPLLIIEVDVKVEVDNQSDYQYKKATALINAGCKEIVWIYTKSRAWSKYTPEEKEGLYLERQDGTFDEPLPLLGKPVTLARYI